MRLYDRNDGSSRTECGAPWNEGDDGECECTACQRQRRRREEECEREYEDVHDD